MKEYLNEIFEYKDGMLFYKKRVSKAIKPGMRAGAEHATGYRVLLIKKVNYKEHRIIWMLHHGEIPTGYTIDHIDGIKNNNKIENLRLATRSQNGCNRDKNRNSSSGYKGVHYHKITNRWYAKIVINGKGKHLGSFENRERAYERYKSEALRLHGEFAKF